MLDEKKVTETHAVLDYRSAGAHRQRWPLPGVIAVWVFRLVLVGIAIYLFGRAETHATGQGSSLNPSGSAIASDNTPGLAVLGFSIGGAAALIASALVRSDARE